MILICDIFFEKPTPVCITLINESVFPQRTMVFQLFIALAGKLNEEILSPLLPTILTPVVRELEMNDEQGATIRLLAEKVRQFYREKIPTDVYDEVITEVQRKLNIKKSKRKITRAQMVSSPSPNLFAWLNLSIGIYLPFRTKFKSDECLSKELFL